MAVARLRRRTGPNRFQVTFGGDGWKAIASGRPAWLYKPPQDLADLSACWEGLDGQGLLITVVVQSLSRTAANRATVSFVSAVDDWEGWWIAVAKADLAESGDLYFFQIRGLPVVCEEDGQAIGTVRDYLETGAGGVLVIQTIDGPVLMPFVRQFVDARPGEGRILVRQFADFKE